MTTEGHIAALKRRHRELEEKIEQELQYKAHDALLVAELKRRKLDIKDELQKFQMSTA